MTTPAIRAALAAGTDITETVPHIDGVAAVRDQLGPADDRPHAGQLLTARVHLAWGHLLGARRNG